MHRLVGFTSFNLMVLHVVTDHLGVRRRLAARRCPATLWQLTVDYPGMLIADAGALCLVMVVVTSIKAARRRLRYESWHLMHLYAYLGVGLALPHQLWTGQQFTASTAKTVFWWTAWALAAAAVLVWRIGVPLALNLRHRLRVTAVVARERRHLVGATSPAAASTGSASRPASSSAGGSSPARAGAGPTPTRCRRRRTAAACGSPCRASATAAHATRGLRPGTRALVEGPYGRLGDRARTRRKVALIGAGVGITPLRALAEGLDYAPGEAVLIERFTDRAAVRRRARPARRPARPAGAAAARATGAGPTRGSAPASAPFDDLSHLLHWVPDIAERDVYVCGPEPWADLVRSHPGGRGLPADHLHLETFAW